MAGFPVQRLPDGRAIAFDIGAVLTIGIAAGFDPRALAELLPAIGAGLMVALLEHDDG